MAAPHDELDVFLNEAKIGKLAEDNGVLSFRYSAEFLNDPGAANFAEKSTKFSIE